MSLDLTMAHHLINLKCLENGVGFRLIYYSPKKLLNSVMNLMHCMGLGVEYVPKRVFDGLDNCLSINHLKCLESFVTRS